MDDAMKRVSRKRLEPYFRLHRDAHYTMIRNWTGESTEEVFYELADEYGLLVWNDFWMSTEGYAPKGLDKPLAALVASKDGTRLYQSNSRNLNLRPIGEAWYYHDLHTGHELYRATLIENYAEAFSLEDYSKKAQMLNYISHREIFEAWNSRLWEYASGVLLWMTHPAWPSMIWQTYSWDYEPLHIQMSPKDRKVLVVYTTLKNYQQLRATATLLDEKGNILHK